MLAAPTSNVAAPAASTRVSRILIVPPWKFIVTTGEHNTVFNTHPAGTASRAPFVEGRAASHFSRRLRRALRLRVANTRHCVRWTTGIDGRSVSRDYVY